MKKIAIGTKGEAFDLDTFLVTRLLIQANSGGGKSHAVRVLVENLFGKVPVIVIDPEGDFATLREKHDFLLVGSEGEIPADPRSAGLLARKLLQLNASAICDLYELRPSDRHLWVKNFVDSLIDAPKALWKPVVIVLDEAHMFAPEKGQGESVSTESVIDLASRGRKRGFCLVAATQRMGKLSKNVTAELQNVMIGSTTQDIDRKRAAENLGIERSEEREYNAYVKIMDPGTFYVLGRAISKERILIKVAPSQTTHVRSGAKHKSAPPPPSAHVTAMLSELKDLPAQAEAKQKTEAELRKELTHVRKELAAEKKLKGNPANIDPNRILAGLKLEDFVKEINEDVTLAIGMVQDELKKLLLFRSTWIQNAKDILASLKKINADTSTPGDVQTIGRPGLYPKTIFPKDPTVRYRDEDSKKRIENKIWASREMANLPTSGLPIGERAILAAAIQFQGAGVERDRLSVLTSYKKSSRDAYIARALTRGLIELRGKKIFPTQAGIDALPNVEALPTGEALQEYWMKNLPEGERKILQILIDAYPDSIRRDSIDEQTSYKKSSRDAYLARMQAKYLIQAANGMVAASDLLFD